MTTALRDVHLTTSKFGLAVAFGMVSHLAQGLLSDSMRRGSNHSPRKGGALDSG